MAVWRWRWRFGYKILTLGSLVAGVLAALPQVHGTIGQSAMGNPVIGALAKSTLDAAYVRLQHNRAMLRRIFFAPLPECS